MQIIKNNPYRIIGILVGTSLKDQTRQISRLKQYIGAEQEPPEGHSFPILGNLGRSIEAVDNAASNLNLDLDKLTNSLFWFYNGNDVTDEPAFDFLKEGNLQDAVSLWAKLTNGKDVNEKNASAFFNLSTLMLNSAITGIVVKDETLEKGLRMRLKYLDSDYYNSIKLFSTDSNFKISKREIQLLFLNQTKSQLDKIRGFSAEKFTTILSSIPFFVKDEYLKGQTDAPINRIEKKVEDAKKKRLLNNSNGNIIGEQLHEETKDILTQLKALLTNSNIKYSAISDKISDEILQCGIDYFLYYRDTNTDPSTATLELFRLAKSLAVGNIAIQRWRENTTELEDWIKDKPGRQRVKKVSNDLERLKALIDNNETKSETVLNAKLYLSSTQPYLANIKAVYGAFDEFYTSLSSRIASDAQGMCVSEINKIQDTLSSTYDQVTKMATMMLLKQRVNEAWEVNNTIGAMDINQNFRLRYNTNRTSLSSLKSQLINVTPLNNVNRQSTYTKPSSSSSSGCYIATMAYGSYDHPQVIILRKFRDQVLEKTQVGKWLIKQYYHHSPKLVEKLKDKKAVNYSIRKILNLFINLIK